jgi:amino acid adenylation domain-containing protein
MTISDELHERHATGRAYGVDDACIHELIAEQAARTPDSIAVESGGAQLTYRELYARVLQLAQALAACGVGPGTFVGICMERSPELVIAILGVLEAGGAYLPLDAAYPVARLNRMVDGTRVSLILTHGTLDAPELAPGVQRMHVCSDLWQQSNAPRDSGVHRRRVVTADNIAYAMYTSGSTGTPQAVLVPHRGVVNHNRFIIDYFPLGGSDRIAQCTSMSFDISVEEIFPALMCGATVVLHPPGVVGAGREFSRWLQTERITVVDLPTAFWHAWVNYLAAHPDELPDGLRSVVVGGEKASRQLFDRWRALAGSRIRWINGYGPTETTVAVTFYSPDDADAPVLAPEDELPIGRAIPGVMAYVLDSTGRPCPSGGIGELHIGGLAVTRGYQGKAALTAARFIPDPFAGVAGARMYRTGDLARYGADGHLRFMGRVDDQVKVRGFRIELGEIESALRQHPDVHDAAVVAHAGADGERRLAAYVVLRGTCTVAALRGALRRRLPEHMIPPALVVLDALPLTITGKTDKARLPVPRRSRDSVAAAFVAPSTDTERALAAIWTSVLGVDDIGVEDSFFDLGGHSLRATQVAARIRDVLGIEMPLADVFGHPTIAGLARAVAARRLTADASAVRQVIPPADRSQRLPLSFSQERVWFLQQLDPGSLAYNFQTFFLIDGTLNAEAMRASLSDLVARHEILRTSFSSSGGEPVQQIHPPFDVQLPVVDLRHVPASERDAALRTMAEDELRRPFVLDALPLIRWVLYRMDDDRHVMLHVEHHLIHDGWTFNVFRRELSACYLARAAGAPATLPALPIQFADFAVWQRAWMSGRVLEAQLGYWKDRLADAATLALPTDRARPAAQTFAGAVHELELDAELYAGLRALSDAMGTTLFITLEAAFFVLLHRVCAQDDVSIGTGVANRRWTETEGLLGMLVNNIVLRSELSGNPAFREFAADVRRMTLEAYAHQDAPFERVVRALGRTTDRSRNPLFQVMFSFHDSPLDVLEVPGLDISCVEALSNRSAKFDLNIVVVPHAEQRFARDRHRGSHGITVLWEYNTALFDDATVTQLAAHYRSLLGAISVAPDTRVFDLPLLDAPLDPSMSVASREPIAYPADGTIHGAFAAAAAHTPDAIAVSAGAVQITYRTLDEESNRLAHRLLAHGVTRGVRVGVCMSRSARTPVVLLAILKAGGAYVPMDPAYPDERLAFIARDAGVRVMLADAASSGRCRAWATETIDVGIPSGALAQEPVAAPEPSAAADDVAYVMFTSGSTGQPKGVVVPHRAVLRLLFGVDYVMLDSTRRILHMAPLSFDSSTFEIWGALLHGACSVVYTGDVPTTQALGELLRREGIDTVWLTASMFNAVIDDSPDALHPVRQLLVGGEPLSVPHVSRALAALPNTAIVNGYGPTESTTFTCCHRIDPAMDPQARSVPIGRPIGNTRVYILDRYLRRVPAGVTGELYIAGDGLAHGYAGRPALTAERFLPDPYGAPGTRMYRSGDLARVRVDGAIEFIGRVDAQVKVRGFRIEPREIEHALRTHASVRDAAVVVRDDLAGGPGLVAYVTVRDRASLAGAALRAHLERLLSAHMVPSRFMTLDELPLMASGKLNRALLPIPSHDALSDASTAATTDIEQAIAAVWQDVLKRTELSVHDNFFDLGGHSLLATRIVARIRDELAIDLPLRALFEHPTIARLSASIVESASAQFSDRRASSRWRYLFPLRSEAGGRPVFFVPGGHGGDYEFLVYARLVHFVGDGFAFHGLRARSADGVEAVHETVAEMARDYVAELLRFEPAGPYRIVGNCIGGVVAYEMARQLHLAGHEVEALILMDTGFPTRERYARHRGTLDSKVRGLQGRIAHHWSTARTLPWESRWSYLFGKTRAAAQLVASVASQVASGAGTASAESAASEEQQRDRVRAAYVDTLRRYEPTPYHGDVTIIANEEDADPQIGWTDVVRGAVHVHRVQGDHESYIRDHVRSSAAVLRRCLEEAPSEPGR